MKSILLLAIPAIVATAPMLYASGAPAPQNPTYYQREIDETYGIDQDAVIRITHSLGDVSIEVWDRNEVHVQGRIEARGEKAREIGEQIKIRVDGRSPLVLETVYPQGEWRNVSYGARLRVRVPRGHALEASNSFGDLKLEGVHGDVTARVGSGKLQVKGAHGTLKLTGSFGSIRVENSRGSTTISGGSTSVDVRNLLDGDLEIQNTFGAVRLEKIQGDVRIENNSGDVIVREVAGSINAQGTFGTHRYTNIQGNLTVKTKSVTITAEHIGGMAHLETAFADVSLQDCSQDACLITQNGQARGRSIGGSLTVDARFGSVTVDSIQGDCSIKGHSGHLNVIRVAGDLTVKHEFGPVRVSGVGGNILIACKSSTVDVHDVSYLNPKGGEANRIDCRTTFGVLNLRLPAPPSMKLDATATFGSIKSDFELSGLIREQPKETCKCTLGKGEAEVTLVSDSGSIQISKDQRFR